MILHCSKQICGGLQFLHDTGVAHRDLKPANLLVSNKQIMSIQDAKARKRLWWQKPCIIKLTDFGESWGNILATASMWQTRTVHVYKGIYFDIYQEYFTSVIYHLQGIIELIIRAGKSA